MLSLTSQLFLFVSPPMFAPDYIIEMRFCKDLLYSFLNWPYVGLHYMTVGQLEKGFVSKVALRYPSHSHFATILG